MCVEQAYLEGFVKRASEYGFSGSEAVYILKQATDGYRDNAMINTEIQSANANPSKAPGSAAIMDFGQGGVPSKTPAYTPTKINTPYPTAALLNHIPVAGKIIGPIARYRDHDYLGAGISAASTAALGLPPMVGVPLSKGLEYTNDAIDVTKHLLNREPYKKFENQNRTVQG